MNGLDFMIILPIGYFAYKGFTAGLIQEVLGIVGMILAVFITFAYMKPVAALFEPMFEGSDAPVIVAGLTLFIGTVGIVQGIGHLAKKFLQLIKLNIINRIAGLCFGAIKSAIVISGFLWLFAGVDLPAEETRNQSVTYPVLIGVAPVMYDGVASVVPGIENFIDTLEKTIREDNPIRNNKIFDQLTI